MDFCWTRLRCSAPQSGTYLPFTCCFQTYYILQLLPLLAINSPQWDLSQPKPTNFWLTINTCFHCSTVCWHSRQARWFWVPPSIKKNLPEQSRTWHPESAGPTERRHDHGLFNLVMHIVNWLLWNSHFLCSSLLWTPAQRGSKWQQQQYLVFGPIRCYRARRWTNLPAQPAQPQCSNHWSPLHWQIIATNSKAHGKRPAIHEAISKIDLSFSIYYLCENLWMRYL